MTTIPVRRPHRTVDADAGVDHPKNAFPPIKPSGIRTGRLACPHPGRSV
jgi:hypothetical protein